MALISDKLNKILSAVFGKDVRQALHDGLDAINRESENTTARQKVLEETFDHLTINAGNSNAEIVAARVKNDGTSFDTIGKRLNDFDEHLETKANLNSVFSMANMGQDVKEALTGGSVAVVGKGAILTENIIPKQITPFTTNFFDIVNFMDVSSIVFNRNVVNVDGSIKAGSTTMSIIFKVEPNTTYKFKNDIIDLDRGNVIGAVDNSFIVGSSYDILITGGLNTTSKVITFTTNSSTNWVMVYFSSEGLTIEYCESIKKEFKLFKNNVPISYRETIKKVHLPQDLAYKGEISPIDTTFFTVYNLLYKFKHEFIDGHCNTNGLVTMPSESKSMIINVEPNMQYYLQLPMNSDRAFILSTVDGFESGKYYTNIEVVNSGSKIYSFTTKEDTKQIFIYYNSANVKFDLNEFSIGYSRNDLDKGISLKKEYIPFSDGYEYIGKKVLTMGDSITAINEEEVNNWDRSWRKYFKEILKPIKLSNTAVPGATWCDKEGTIYDGNPVINGADKNVNNVMGNQVEKLLRARDTNNPNYAQNLEFDDDFDIIIIACGTNDTHREIPTNEEIESNFYSGNNAISNLSLLDKKTWTGAMRYCIDTLRSLYPNAKIFISTPIQKTTGGKYIDILEKNILMKSICKRLSVPVIDSMLCGVYDMTCPTGGKEGDFNDGLHLSPQGASKLGYYIANEVKNNYY